MLNCKVKETLAALGSRVDSQQSQGRYFFTREQAINDKYRIFIATSSLGNYPLFCVDTKTIAAVARNPETIISKKESPPLYHRP